MKRQHPGRAATGQGQLKIPLPGRDRLNSLLQDSLKCLQEGRFKEGEILCQKALRSFPDNADAHHLSGLLLHGLGQSRDAIEHIRRAIALNRRFAPFHNSLGTVLAESKLSEEAARAFEKAIELQPNYPEAISNLGALCKNVGRYEESIKLHRRAIALRPDYPDAHNNLGNTLLRQEEAAAAVEAYRSAVKLRPNHAPYRNNLAAALTEDDRLEAAITECHAALRLRPEYAEAYANLGTALKDAGRYDEAEAAFKRAIDINPGNADAMFAESLIDLVFGRYASGWEKYEYRWQWSRGQETPRHNAIAPWNGSPPRGRKILIWDEQGVGDKIMFAKALPSLLAQCERVVIEVEPRLVPLFTRSFPSAAAVISSKSPLGAAGASPNDFQSPLGSLCRWLMPDPADISHDGGYLRADPELTGAMRQAYRKFLGDRPLVGVSWRGGTGKKKRLRSIPLQDLTPILEQSDFAFLNLQYGDCRSEIAQFQGQSGISLHSDDSVDALQDIDRFAAQVAAMDLVITIDNSTAHLAGALGMPVWVMLPVVPEWRWQLDRSDSVWYPRARLFRQRSHGDWGPVIGQVAAELRGLASAGAVEKR